MDQQWQSLALQIHTFEKDGGGLCSISVGTTGTSGVFSVSLAEYRGVEHGDCALIVSATLWRIVVMYSCYCVVP